MHTLQAATATQPPGTASDPPRAGDGFTFEHLADRPQLWLDFCADTGDGGDPTYAVARAMAAPGLQVGHLLACSSSGIHPLHPALQPAEASALYLQCVFGLLKLGKSECCVISFRVLQVAE